MHDCAGSLQESVKGGLSPVRPEQKVPSTELEGKPNLREPRRVKRAISYQYQRLKPNPARSNPSGGSEVRYPGRVSLLLKRDSD